jgi:competence transcription factor ComK
MRRIVLNPIISAALFFYATISSGCESNALSLSKQDEQFALVYAEMLLVHSDYERVNGGGVAFSKLDTLQLIFSSHGFSAQLFQEQYARYMNDAERWNKVQERAISILNKLREQTLNAQREKQAQNNDAPN